MCDGTSFTVRRFAWLWAIFIAVLLDPAHVRAHLEDEGGIDALLMGVEGDDSGGQNLIVFIVNNTALSITLRGITTREGDPANLSVKRQCCGLMCDSP